MELIKTLYYLEDLVDDEEPATPKSIMEVTKILKEVDNQMLHSFPYGSSSGIKDGGIRIEWSKHEKSVVFLYRTKGKSYIYVFYYPTKKGTIVKNITAKELAKQLDWFQDTE